MIPAWRSLRFWIFTLLAISFFVRLALVWHGGQYFFPDESRYDRGVLLYQALLAGDLAKARSLALLPEHMLFTWCAAIVAVGQHLLAQLTPYGNWAASTANVTFTTWIGATLLSLFSTLNLALTHRLARVLGANAGEATWALLVMATANSAFYYVRHLLPYECALSFALLALIIGLGGATRTRALACGFLAGITYGIYNGYWYLVPVISLTYAQAIRREPGAVRRMLLCGAGAGLGLALPVVIGTLVDGDYYWSIVQKFSRTAVQGSLDEGWSLPWKYLWHAEGVAGVAVVIAILAAIMMQRRRNEPLDRRAGLMLLALGSGYALLVLCSNGLRFFVVYGRTVKPFVPLLCLLAGWALAQLLGGRSPRAKLAVAVALVTVGALHFWPHFSRLFPREIEIAVLRNWGNPKRTLSVSGSLYLPLALPVTRPDLALVNAQMLHPVHEHLGYPAGRTVARFDHPLTFTPFQYEGFTPAERGVLRAHDISIRLIALANPAEVPNDLPPHLGLQHRPPAAKK